MNTQITTVEVDGQPIGHIAFVSILKMWAAVHYDNIRMVDCGVYENQGLARNAVFKAAGVKPLYREPGTAGEW